MPTPHQDTGAFGEERVVKDCACPRCKRRKTLVRLPSNFKCADVVCDFCGYLGQVKTTKTSTLGLVPNQITGAAWGPQRERMAAGIYFPLFLVLVHKETNEYFIYYLPSDLQNPEMFLERPPLSATAKRTGWQGFNYDLRGVKSRFVQLVPAPSEPP
jgi:hypothetical protein